MKKLSNRLLMLLTNVVTSLSFEACSDDKDNELDVSQSLIGTWESTEWRINGKSATLRAVFRDNNTGTLSAIYTDGTDTDSYNFEYMLKNPYSDPFF